MKIRIKGDFVRYRLVQTEVRQLSEGKRLVEHTRFGPAPEQVFSYALESKAGIEELRADFANNTITLFIPEQAAKAWPDEARVGFEVAYEVAPGVQLKLLLEKDFVCLDTTDEDQSDNYPNPNTTC